MGDVSYVDAGGGKGGLPGSKVLSCSLAELAVATAVHLGPRS